MFIGLIFHASNDVLCRLPDTSATRHFGIKTLWDTLAPISRHFDTKTWYETLRHECRDRGNNNNNNTFIYIAPACRMISEALKSRDTSTQDISDETQLHWWFVLNFCTNFVALKCPRVSWCRSVLWPKFPAPLMSVFWHKLMFSSYTSCSSGGQWWEL